MLSNQTVVNQTTSVVLNDTPQPASIAINATNMLNNMEAQRITWEQGAFRTSNQALYAVLAQCLSFCGELPMADAKQRSTALETFFKARGYKYKKESPLVTRAVKAVFGNIDRRRVSTYSLVLRQAQKENVATANLAQWIEDKGGLQEIRLGHSATFVSPKAKAEIAKQSVEGRSFIGFAKSELLSVTADADFMGEKCVLLAEQQADGSYGIRAVLRNESLVNAAYAALYAKQQEVQAKAKAEVNAANDANGAVTTATKAA
ncbi:hypothetical protein G6671_08015 [Polynucleobacter paneuropaeus]|nr:hypothetical protein G6671_08015 [Polynucleobacter paneuropaeus]